VRTHTGRLTLDAARSAQPDVIMLDEALPSADTHALCRALRDDAEVGPSTPILVSITRRPTTKDHMAALRVGVWEFLVEPLPAEELTARVGSYVAARQEPGQRTAQLVDETTGLVSLHGLTRRARELTLQAFHHYAPLACVALAPAAGSPADAPALIAETLRLSGRRSDAIGALGPGEFLVVAPGANGSGAVKLAERFVRLVQATATRRGRPVPKLRAGYDAVANVHYTPLEPRDLLGHAASALRERGVGTSETWIRRYEEG